VSVEIAVLLSIFYTFVVNHKTLEDFYISSSEAIEIRLHSPNSKCLSEYIQPRNAAAIVLCLVPFGRCVWHVFSNSLLILLNNQSIPVNRSLRYGVEINEKVPAQIVTFLLLTVEGFKGIVTWNSLVVFYALVLFHDKLTSDILRWIKSEEPTFQMVGRI